MMFLLDACVPSQLGESLVALGADVACPQAAMPDDEVLRSSVAQGRVLITADKDFGALVFHQAAASLGVILIRYAIVSNEKAQHTAERIRALAEYGAGAFTVLEYTSLRVHKL